MAEIRPHFDMESRSILADVVPLDMPYCVQVEVSQLCNIKCNYCVQSFVDNKDKVIMGFETFAVMCARISQFKEPLKQVNFAGWGEPLINPDLPFMIRYIRNIGITENIAVITNGILLTPAVAESLLDAGVNQIRISLQGLTMDKYGEICGRKINVESIISNIRYLYRNKEECQVYVKIADTALDPGGGEKFYEIFNDISDIMYIETIRPMFKENVQDDKMLSRYGTPHAPVLVCPQPFFMMNVMADGRITPCCSYYDPTGLGNVKDESLKEIWDSRWMRGFRIMMLKKDRKHYPVCRSCLMPDATLTPGDDLDEKAEVILRRVL